LKYEVIVYYLGPRTSWIGRVDESEVIARRAISWRWLAERWGKSLLAQLDPTKCGIAIRANGVTIVDVSPFSSVGGVN